MRVFWAMVVVVLAVVLLLISVVTATSGVLPFLPNPVDVASRNVFPIYDDTKDDSRACTAFAVTVREARALYYYGLVTIKVMGSYTAGHCGDAHFVRLPGGTWYRLFYPYTVQTFRLDSAYFWVHEKALQSIGKRPVVPLETAAKASLREGDRLVSVGYGDGVLRSVSMTYLGDQRGKGFVRADQPIRGGMSGSPVITQDGKVVGIITHVQLLSPYRAYFTYVEDAEKIRDLVLEEGR